MRNDCAACRLSECRTQMVEPDGATDSILAVGEAPGAEEDERGVGFIGAAGRTLRREIEAITGLPREGWSRANIVRCRPPNNRKPFADEVRSCTDKLKEAIERQNPRVILAVGESAGRVLCGERLRAGAYLPQVARMIADAQQRGSQALPLYEGRRVIPMPHTSGLAWNRTYKTPEGNRKIAELGRDAIRLAAQCFPVSGRPWTAHGRIAKAAEQAAAAWFVRACEGANEGAFLHYKPGYIGFWISRKHPGEHWVRDIPISNGMNEQEIASFIFDRARSLPIVSEVDLC